MLQKTGKMKKRKAEERSDDNAELGTFSTVHDLSSYFLEDPESLSLASENIHLFSYMCTVVDLLCSAFQGLLIKNQSINIKSIKRNEKDLHPTAKRLMSLVLT